MNNIKIVSYESFTEWNLIGEGSFGKVYKAKHKELKVHLAVKKLKEDGSLSNKELLEEAKKIKSASENHYVVPLFGIVQMPPCLVMTLMKYGSLGTLLEKVKDVPFALKYRILHEVAIGMNWLHSLLLLHLDLKPTNVLLDDALHIKITDFGLSRYASTSSACGGEETIGGTTDYMPPEAFQEGYKPSTSTDIYSFAILSAVVLRGADPYPVQNSDLVKMHVCDGQRPSFDSLVNVSSEKNLFKAIEFTKLCWDNDKDKRPSFGDCCNRWETIISTYEDIEIIQAELTTLKCMACIGSSGSKTGIPPCASAASANTTEMSALIKEFNTIHISESPSALQQSVPIRNPNSNLVAVNRQRLPQPNRPSTPGLSHRSNIRTGSVPVRSHQVPPNHFMPMSNFRPSPFPMPVFSQPYVSYQTQVPNFRMNVQPGYFPGHFMPRHQPVNFSSVPSHSSVSNVTITDSSGPLQIGDNNFMGIQWTRNHSGPVSRPIIQRPNQATARGYPSAGQTSNITITNNTGPVQIGDNNEMFAMGPSRNQGSHTTSVTPSSDQTVQRSSPLPTQSTKPAQASHACLTFQPGGAIPGESKSLQEIARRTNKPSESVPIQATTSLPPGDDSNPGNTQQELSNAETCADGSQQ